MVTLAKLCILFNARDIICGINSLDLSYNSTFLCKFAK